MRGTRAPKSVWIATQSIRHTSGHDEQYIAGVFADRETAVQVQAEFCELTAPVEVSHWDFDGDCYMRDPETGYLRCKIQRHDVRVSV